MKNYRIYEVNNGEPVETVAARNQKSALRKFKEGLMSSGYYYLVFEDDAWVLRTSYGRSWKAYEVSD